MALQSGNNTDTLKIVQICHQCDDLGKHNPAGAGFQFTTGGLIVTAAHVLTQVDSLGDRRFIIGILDKETISYALALQIDISGAADHDVAFLRLVGFAIFPCTPKWSTARNKRFHKFWSFGFPAAGPINGIYAQGEVLRPVYDSTSEKIQLETENITAGFSGAPVIDEGSGRIIGMVQSVLREDSLGKLQGVAFMLSSDAISSLMVDVSLADVEPYVGLKPFDESLTAYYHGRKDDISSLLSLLAKAPNTIIVAGSSGSGKSSLINAGIIPVIRGSASNGSWSDAWSVLRVPSLSKPYAQLASLGLSPSNWVESIAAQSDQRRRVLLVLDQSEELFIDCSADDRRSLIQDINALPVLASNITVMFIIREDFRKELLSSLKAQVVEYSISPAIPADDLRPIIAQPAIDLSDPFSDELVAALIEDCVEFQESTDAPVLPLLEFAVTQLWNAKQNKSTPDYEVYTSMGRLSGCLSRWAEGYYSTLSSGDQDLFRSILLDLVNPVRAGDSVILARRRVAKRDLAALRTQSEEKVMRVLFSMGSARLITSYLSVSTPYLADQDNVYIDVIHESLFSRWRRMRDWVRPIVDQLLTRNFIADRCDQWCLHPNRRNLLSGTDLRSAQTLLYRCPDYFRSADRDFISRSLTFKRFKRRASVIGPTLLGLLSVLTYASVIYTNRLPFPGYHIVQAAVDLVPPQATMVNETSIKDEAAKMAVTLADSLATEAAYQSPRHQDCDEPWHFLGTDDACHLSVWDSSQALLALTLYMSQPDRSLNPDVSLEMHRALWPRLIESLEAQPLSDGTGWQTSRAANDSISKTLTSPWQRNGTKATVGGGSLEDFANSNTALWRVAMLASILQANDLLSSISSGDLVGPLRSFSCKGMYTGQSFRLDPGPRAKCFVTQKLQEAQQFALRYITPGSHGETWNLFLKQQDERNYSSYASTVALLAAIESSAAGRPLLANGARGSISDDAPRVMDRLVRHFSDEDFDAWPHPIDKNDAHPEALDFQIATELLLANTLSTSPTLLSDKTTSNIEWLIDRMNQTVVHNADDLHERDGTDSLGWRVTTRVRGSAQPRKQQKELVIRDFGLTYGWYPWALATASLWYRYALERHLGWQVRNRALRTYAMMVHMGAVYAVPDALNQRTWQKAELLIASSLAANGGLPPPPALEGTQIPHASN